MSEKGKKIQKISIFAALVMVIGMVWGVSAMANTSTVVYGDTCYAYGDISEDGKITTDDAIYLLYNSVFGDESYPIANYEKEGEITALDAISILSLVGKDAAHAYNEPIWQWTEDGKATAVFHCACGKGKTLVKEAEVTAVKTEATCITEGIAEYTATVTLLEGHTYTVGKTVQTSPATGIHTYASDVVCSDRTCTVEGCGHVEPAAGHDYVVAQSTSATCTEAATVTYKCKSCNVAEYTVEDGSAKGHTYGTAVETLIAGCKYKEVYTCSDCNHSVDGKTYDKHEGIASIKTEATCSHEGTKVYTCKTCKEELKSETIAKVADAHNWNDGEEKGTLIVYSCKETGCTQTRTAINAAAVEKVEVTSEVLKETNEIDLNGTSLKLDEATKAQLPEKVEIKADTTTAEELELPEELKDQIGENPIYDFSITAGDTSIEKFDGAITISLPYTLQEGDDVDCIDVWFIADDGTVQAQKGTYANGHVTFKATHFSYYTVTRLTPAERCKQYGHNDATSTVEATCTAGGYELHVCARCNETWKENETAALGHKTTTTTTKATCTEAGKTVVACANCDYKSTTTAPAKGHVWEETDEKATCEGTKTVKIGCANCDAEKEITLAQLKHDTTTTSVPATCIERAYDLIECKNCDYELKEYTGTAKGHTYEVTWKWNEETFAAEATFACTTTGCTDSFVEKADVTITKELPTSCEKDGYRNYLAKVVYNSRVYTSEYTEVIPATGHNVTDAWEHNATQHYHVCSLCGGKLEAEDHSYDSVVTKEATCTEDGLRVHTCKVCGYEKKETIPAKGHNFVDNVCTDCGYSIFVCDHKNLHVVEEEFKAADGFCGGTFTYEVCDCEEVKYFVGYDFRCEFEYDEERVKDENGYIQFEIEASCDKCGLHLEEVDSWVINKENCTGTQYMDTTIYDKNNNEIFTFSGINGDVEDVPHPNAVYGEPDDLKKYGMCEGEISKIACPCGRDEMLIMDMNCIWVDVPDECKEGLSVYQCPECDTKIVNEYGSKEIGQCKMLCSEKYTFVRDGKDLVSYEYSFEMENHNSELSYELLGETCSDGINVHETCKDCGFDGTYFIKTPEGVHHEFKQIIDVSGYDLCVDEIHAWVCPCGEYARAWEFEYAHSWGNSDWSEEDREDGYLLKGHDECIYCGLERDIKEDVTYTGNGCEIILDFTCVYTVDGKVIFTEKNAGYDSRHAFEVVDYELLGQSCEDGVVLTMECSDCGEVIKEYRYYHEHFQKASYDAAKFGMCEGLIRVGGCACGEEGWISEENACIWTEIGYDEETGTITYECEKCGTINEVTRKEEKIDSCNIKVTWVYEYIQGATVVLSTEFSTMEESHNYTYTFEIEEGKKCEDGFIVNMVCQGCGDSTSWMSQAKPGEHINYVSQRYDMKELGFCSGELRIYECPCGEASHVNFENTGCYWQWEEGYEDHYTMKCAFCNGTREVYEEEGKSEGCYVEVTVTNKLYDANGEEKAVITTQETYGRHDFDIYFEIADGASCSDGYTVIRDCKLCDEVYSEYTQTPEGMHETYLIESYDMTEYGFCGGEVDIWACPCGARKETGSNIHGYCNFVPTGDMSGDKMVFKCTECNGSFERTSGYELIDKCHEKQFTITSYYAPDGKYLFATEYAEIYEIHENNCTFTLNGTSCEDGYTVVMECKNCGEVNTDSGYNHTIYYQGSTDLTEFGLCEGRLYLNRCACGMVENTGTDSRCEWETVNYDPTTNSWIRECINCGAQQKETACESAKDANCMVYVTSYYELYTKAGELIAKYSNSYSHTMHNMITEFNMLGDSCEDGYYVTYTCRDCNRKEQNTTLFTGHSTWYVESIELADLGMCDGQANYYACACGEQERWEVWSNCRWNWNGTPNPTCSNCGVTRTEEYSNEEIDSCHTKHVSNYTYTKNGEVIFAYTSTGYGENHDAVFTLTLKNPNGDCYDGYVAEGFCNVCKENVRYEGYEHIVYAVEKEDLSDDGLCEGTSVVRQECACGRETYVSDISYDGSCHWQYMGATNFSYSWEYDAVSAEAYICVDSVSAGTYSCGAVKKIGYAVLGKDANCNETLEVITVYYNKAGEAVYAYTESKVRENHNYELIDVEMNDKTNCNAGYYEVYQCKDCGKTERNYNDWHVNKNQTYYNLTEYGACAGAFVYVNNCYCGQNSNYGSGFMNCRFDSTYNEYVENGETHYVSVYRCQECDLFYKEDSVRDMQENSCFGTEYTTITMMIGDKAVTEPFVAKRSIAVHDTVQTATLVEGATSCTDGVIVTEKCKNCDDYYWQNTYNWHYELEVERYDFKDYGAVCGGSIVRRACLCGEYVGFGFADMECDMSYTQVSNEEEFTGQNTTHGWNNYWRYEQIRKCAVTDPECGFAIYETNYHEWDEENCTMIAYTSWKLGYDDKTGSFKEEIIFETGRNAYHAYVTTTTEDGNSTTSVCKYCGSSYVNTHKYDENYNLIYSEETAINTLDNGENQKFSSIEDRVVYKNYSYTVNSHYETVGADGTVWYDNYDYAYDWDNFDCTAICTYTNSNGAHQVTQEDVHKGWNEWYYEKVCSQGGRNYLVCHCEVCETDAVIEEYELMPGHNWGWHVDGYYFCADCGLESTVGADGSIVFEDMTTEYGNGTDYVIGYYQNNNVKFSNELWVVLEDGSNVIEIPVDFDPDKFQFLTKEADGIRAIKFNKADAEAAAIAALNAAGITDTEGFALRFIFFPESSDGDLDYAITLTDESIAK